MATLRIPHCTSGSSFTSQVRKFRPFKFLNLTTRHQFANVKMIEAFLSKNFDSQISNFQIRRGSKKNLPGITSIFKWNAICVRKNFPALRSAPSASWPLMQCSPAWATLTRKRAEPDIWPDSGSCGNIACWTMLIWQKRKLTEESPNFTNFTKDKVLRRLNSISWSTPRGWRCTESACTMGKIRAEKISNSESHQSA